MPGEVSLAHDGRAGQYLALSRSFAVENITFEDCEGGEYSISSLTGNYYCAGTARG
jgi:hypothetical protein